MRFGSVVFSIRNSIIGVMSQTSELSSSVVYTDDRVVGRGSWEIDRDLHVRRPRGLRVGPG